MRRPKRWLPSAPESRRKDGAARLLALQGADGQWAGGTLFPKQLATTSSLMLLRDLGLDPQSEEARRAIGLVREHSRWDHAGQPFFEGEVEPRINGRAVTLGAYFGQDAQGIVDRLLTEQMSDGGWNCEQENGSTRGSFHSTICVLEGLLEHDRASEAHGRGRPRVSAGRNTSSSLPCSVGSRPG